MQSCDTKRFLPERPCSGSCSDGKTPRTLGWRLPSQVSLALSLLEPKRVKCHHGRSIFDLYVAVLSSESVQNHRPRPSAPLLLTLLCVLGAPGVAHSQSPQPRALPNLDIRSSGEVRSVLVLSTGETIVGGNFRYIYDPATQLNINRQYLAKFTQAGALDLSWDPSPNGFIDALAEGPDGSLFVAGRVFSAIAGQPRSCVAKFLPSGVLDPQWNPSFSFGEALCVYSIAVDSSNKVFVGGGFFAVNGVERTAIAKLDGIGSGSLDASWNPNITLGGVRNLIVAQNNAIYLAGNFATIGGFPRSSGLAKVSSVGSGALDVAWDPTIAGPIITLAFSTTNHLYVGGGNGVAKLDAGGLGSVVTAWNPNPNSTVRALYVDGADAIYLAGSFSSVAGVPRQGFAKVSQLTGQPDLGWDVQADGDGSHVVAGGPQRVTIAGGFSSVGGVEAIGLGSVSRSTAAPIQSQYILTDGLVDDIAVGADGALYVTGSFLRVGALTRANIFRVTPSGSLDLGFVADTNGRVVAVAERNGAVYVGGGFTAVNGQARNGVARLGGSSGVVDAAWNVAAPGVTAIEIDSGGGVFIAGSFTQVNGVSRRGIAKLAAQGPVILDGMWAPILNGSVRAIAVDGSGHLYLGGTFNQINGVTRRFGRLSTSGSGALDSTWTSGLDASFNTLTVPGDGFVYVGGGAVSINGVPLPRLVRVSVLSAAIDPTWQPSPDGGIDEILVVPGDGVFVTGFFGQIGGGSRFGIAKVRDTGSGAAVAGWNPGAQCFAFRDLQLPCVSTLARLDSTSIAVGGQYSSIGGLARRLVAVLPDGSGASTGILFADSFEAL